MLPSQISHIHSFAGLPSVYGQRPAYVQMQGKLIYPTPPHQTSCRCSTGFYHPYHMKEDVKSSKSTGSAAQKQGPPNPSTHLNPRVQGSKIHSANLQLCSWLQSYRLPSVQQNCKSQFLMMKGPLFSKHMLKPDPHNYIISRRPNQIVSYRVSALRQKSAQHFNSLDQK